MKADQNDWIDPRTARQLMLEYRQALGIKGASEIERQIDKHTRLGISRKTLENWLNDPAAIPSAQTVKIVQRFLQTEHFSQVVPHARDSLDSGARLRRIGVTLFDLYGVKDEDWPVSVAKNAYLAGWWTAPPFFRSNSNAPSYLHMAPIPDHPFSRVHVLVRSHDVPTGSGVMFPTTTSAYLDFSLRVWSQGRRYREKALKIYCMPHRQTASEEKLKLFFEREGVAPGLNTLNVAFSRVDEADVPDPVKALFAQWDRHILPDRLGEWTFIG